MNFNPHSPCGERRNRLSHGLQRLQISIHAPRVGSDGDETYYSVRLFQISIHAPRVGSDPARCPSTPAAPQFQSTLPVWGATIRIKHRYYKINNFNPRSPCGERRGLGNRSFCGFHISIHAPRVGSDLCVRGTAPAALISIHAPRVGSDNIALIDAYELGISIHAPRVGSDRPPLGLLISAKIFQSTLPVWGAT
ncbi:Uncharacterised protein [uncultured Clostridium sp.]|nr:Uncharacterised protein [uncultured Clostridium sp.]